MFSNSSKLFIPIRFILLIFLKLKSIPYIIKSNPSNIIKLVYIFYLIAEAVAVIIVTAAIADLKNLVINILTIRIIVATKIFFLTATIRRRTLSPLNLIKRPPLKSVIYFILISVIKFYSIKRPTPRTFL